MNKDAIITCCSQKMIHASKSMYRHAGVEYVLCGDMHDVQESRSSTTMQVECVLLWFCDSA
jgi:hypothetical protein